MYTDAVLEEEGWGFLAFVCSLLVGWVLCGLVFGFVFFFKHIL